MTPEEAYLLGLICARGHLYTSTNKILIDFAHKNEIIRGLAHCHKCGDIATQRKKDNPKNLLFCRSCETEVSASAKQVYEQKASTEKSLDDTIIPYLSSVFEADYSKTGNNHNTFLVMKFRNNKFSEIVAYFDNKSSFDSFTIPKEIFSVGKMEKQEFVGGLLDTTGFFNAGSWNVYGRLRGYLQIVRNWKITVQICNFLRLELKLPIQTIDWGHPNIRDSKMTESNRLSWAREHQIKFFPEYYQKLPIRIDHKKKMFQELANFNEANDFDRLDDCAAPTSIPLSRVKAYHYEEDNSRIPEVARKHCDAFWQVCHYMGCKYTNRAISNSNNPQYYLLTGMDEDRDFDSVVSVYHDRREELTKDLLAKKKKKQAKQKGSKKKRRTNPEQKLYDPISRWLKKYLDETSEEQIRVHDTSAFHLNKFILRNNLYDKFDFCDNYKIKPDVVGFMMDSKDLIFVEVKVGPLTIQDIGQLLGYSLVGMPKLSILISPEKTSINLTKTLEAFPNLLDYGSKRIELGWWDGEKCVFSGEEK